VQTEINRRRPISSTNLNLKEQKFLSPIAHKCTSKKQSLMACTHMCTCKQRSTKENNWTEPYRL